MNNINISFMTDDAIETLRENSAAVTEKLRLNQNNSEWIKDFYKDKIFQEKTYKIKEFNLSTSSNGNYSEVDYQNSILLYESLKDLPRYILTDERFWAWINFTVGYKAALQAMPIKKTDSTFKDHWLFSQGARRGLFFGVMSRCYFRVELTVDESLDDKYELTKFVIENPERFRNLTWRSNSSNKHIILGALKAEKAICEKYGKQVKNSIYPEIAKQISLFGSVRLIDVVTEDDIYQFVYSKMEEIIKQQSAELVTQ